MALIAAAAVAAGLTRSARYDAKRLAYQALEEKYGFTTDMESFFTCTAEEKDGQTVVTYRANKDVGDFAWKLGDYTVTIRNGRGWRRAGQTTAKRSAMISPPMCGIRRFWRAASRGAKQGEEWYGNHGHAA
ncbi:MAG: hypothetical protein ACLR4A_17020 [Christensenellales bacterium]